MSSETTLAPPFQPFRPLEPSDPREIGGYRLLALIGEGGMGRVYYSRTLGGRPVAFKVIKPEYADDPAFRRRFEREIATAQRVQGYYTAPVIDAGPQAPQPWLATAYVPGPSLRQAVGAYGQLPVASVLVLTAGVAEALRSIHAAGVVHRDLKPSNVILTEDGPKVIDFGIARALEATSAHQTSSRAGTPAFMAPEQVRGAAVTPAIDVFALGALAYYAATGELPFGGADPAVLYRILEQEPDLALCPQPLRLLLSRCLDKDPQRRPTPAEVLELCRPSSVGTGLPMDEDWLPYSLAVEARQFAESRMPAVPARSGGPRWRAALLAAGAAIVGGAVMLTAVWSGVLGFPGSDTRDAANTTTNTTRNTATSTGANYIGQYDVYLSGGYGILLDDPNTQVPDSATPAPDLWFTTAGALFYNRNADRAAVLSGNQAPDYQTCVTDTRYVANWYFPRFESGDYFCVISSGRVGLLKVAKVPGPNGTNQYYQFSLTLWRLAGR